MRYWHHAGSDVLDNTGIEKQPAGGGQQAGKRSKTARQRGPTPHPPPRHRQSPLGVPIPISLGPLTRNIFCRIDIISKSRFLGEVCARVANAKYGSQDFGKGHSGGGDNESLSTRLLVAGVGPLLHSRLLSHGFGARKYRSVPPPSELFLANSNAHIVFTVVLVLLILFTNVKMRGIYSVTFVAVILFFYCPVRLARLVAVHFSVASLLLTAY